MRKLSKRNKEMVRIYATNPKVTKKEAYMATHHVGENTKDTSLYSQVTEAFSNPLVKSELDKYSNLSEEAVIGTVKQYKDSDIQWERTLATNTAIYVHDKIHGKATQRVETQATTVNINLDLTGV